MKPTEPSPHLAGETVAVSYIADPVVGHGKFRLDNPTSGALRAAVDAAWLDLDGLQRTLTDVTVYDLNHETSVDPADFQVEPGVTNLLVGFPSIAHEPGLGASTAVGLRLRMDGLQREALSPIEFVRRIPYGL